MGILNKLMLEIKKRDHQAWVRLKRVSKPRRKALLKDIMRQL